MKKISVFLYGLFLLLAAMGSANATLTTIGTAQFNGTDMTYNLIWDHDNKGLSLVWLDYTNAADSWSKQASWAAGLSSTLTLNLLDGYSVAWDEGAWRLPLTVDGPNVYGHTGNTTAGYNITNSEMGHLYYHALGNLGFIATDGTCPQPGWGLKNTEDFDNLVSTIYWSGSDTEANNTSDAWFFEMRSGYQGTMYKTGQYCGLALRSGQVSTVPAPGAIWLVGSGLIGMIGVGSRKQKIQIASKKERS